MTRSNPPSFQVALVALLGVALLASAEGAGAESGPDAAPASPVGFTQAPPGTVLGPPTTLAAEDLTFNLSAVSSAFGQETYKEDDRFNTRNPHDLENQTTNWANALGHRISFEVRVSGGDIDLTCDDRFNAEAFIQTDDGPLWGWTNGTFRTDAPSGAGDVCPSGVPGVRLYNLTFDLDGAPPTVQPHSGYPALGSDVYAATLNLYYAERPSPTNPTGDGGLAGTYQIPFAIAQPDLRLDTPFQRFPEQALRLFSDVGALPGFADQFQMMPRPLTRTENTTLSITFTGTPVDAPFERVDHVATRTGVGLRLPADPPDTLPPIDNLGNKVENVDERGTVTVHPPIKYRFDNDTVPPSRQVHMQVRGAEFATAESPTTTYTPLHVVTLHVPATLATMTTGATHFVAAVSDETFPVRTLTVDGGVGGLTGSTRLTLRDNAGVTGGPAGNDAGDLFALADRGYGHETITRSTLIRDSGTEWVRGSLRHSAFGDPVSSYTMLAMLYGPSDEFLGMTKVTRGIDIQPGALRTVEGRSGTLPLTITNLGTDGDATPGEADFAVTVRITSNANFPDGSAFNHTEQNIPEGGSVTIEVPVVASTPGDFNVVFTATSGELTDEADTTIQVITKERAREEGRKWYQIPGPSAVVLVAALLGLAAHARRRG